MTSGTTRRPGATEVTVAPYPELMLFDLRGKGRRRVVQVVYLGLAILIGGGLVLFGIGGATSGGVADIFGNPSADTNGTFQANVEKAQKQAQANPANAAAWAALAKARYQLAGVGDNFNQGTQTFTDKGKVQLAGVNAAWQKYLALNPPKPDPNVAALMVQAYSQGALNKPDDVVTAEEIVVDSRPPSAALYAQLASYALIAGQSRKAELAEKKALSLAADKAERAQIKQAIEQQKQQIAQDQAATAGATPSSGTAGATSGGAAATP